MKRSTPPSAFRDGIPDYVNYEGLAKIEQEFLEWYRLNAPSYDSTLPITFEILGCDEDFERAKLYQALELEPSSKVLELGAGTGRDSEKIAKELGNEGLLVMQDISSDILKICHERFNLLKSSGSLRCDFDFFLSNALEIPYPDNSFNRVFHFGGLNTFGNISSTLREISRVAEENAIVVIGDEGLAPWLKDSRFGKVLIATNSQYSNSPPLSELPETACDVKLQWFCSEAFYFITYKVRKSPRSKANFDVEIPGLRGGSPRKRADGVLEGISPDLRDAIYKEALAKGVSRVRFMENLLSKYKDENK